MTSVSVSSTRVHLLSFSILCVGASGLGCSDLDIVPANAQLSCASAADCPDAFVCRESIGECISEDVLNLDPIAFVFDPTLDRVVLSRQPTYSSAAFSADLSTDPSRSLEVFVGTKALDCGDGVELRCPIDALDLELNDGVHAVSVIASDVAGNELRGSVDFFVDNTPPDLVASPFRLIPTEGNPRTQISALGANIGRAEVDLVFSEPLAEVPSVRLLGSPVIDLIPIDPPADPTTEVAFRFSLTIGDVNAEQGPRAIALTATDTVGNSITLTTTIEIEVDTTAPDAPTTDIEDAIVFRRIPWGSSETTAFAPSFSIVGVAGSVEANAFIRSRVGPALSDLLTGEGVADATGAMNFDLLPFDVPRVYLSAIDGAGNESERAVVHDIEWTASLGGKISGSVVENPHRFLRSPNFSPLVLRQDRASEVGSTAALTRAPGAGFGLNVVSDSTFVDDPKVAPGSLPILGAAAAFHAGRGTVMVFGGQVGNFGNTTNDLYEIVGNEWRLVVTENKPFRGDGQMVYEPTYDRLLLLLSNILFAFEDGDWRQLPVAAPVQTSTTPDGILDGKLVYDPVTARTMLSNGVRTSFFDGQSWSPILESPQVPARNSFAMAFDPAEQKIVLYGGSIGPNFLGDRWHFDEGIDGGTWVAFDDTEPNAGVNLVADTNRNVLFAIGGSECFPDTNDPNFACTRPIAIAQRFAPDTGVLAPVGDFGMDAVFGATVFDPVNDRILWIGGIPRISSFGGPNNNFVALDAEDYSADNLNVVPPAMRRVSRHFGVYDPSKSESVFLFGSDAAKAVSIYDDANVLGSDGGRVIGSTTVEPEFRARPFFDGETIVFRAGLGVDAFVRRVDDGWVTQPSGGFPEGAAAAYHQALDTVFGFGGLTAPSSSATFSYSGGIATPVVTATTPPPRDAAQLLYDDRREVIFMFGGRGEGGNLLDTWTFDGTDWTQVSESGPFESFDGFTFFFDQKRGRPMLLRSQSVFEFTASGWQRPTFAVEDQRSQQAYAYDSDNNVIVSQGGVLGNATINAIQTHTHDDDRRPVHIFDVDLRTRRAAPTDVIQSVSIRALAGGRGYTLVERPAGQTPDVDVDDGATLHVWTDRFRPLASNAAALEAQGVLDTTIDDEQTLTGIGDQRLRLALTPAQGQGPRSLDAVGAELSTRAIEVVIRYRE